MKLPVFRVRNAGLRIEEVRWYDEREPPTDSAQTPSRRTEYDMIGMSIVKIERELVPGALPVVRVTFIGRLVELGDEA